MFFLLRTENEKLLAELNKSSQIEQIKNTIKIAQQITEPIKPDNSDKKDAKEKKYIIDRYIDDILTSAIQQKQLSDKEDADNESSWRVSGKFSNVYPDNPDSR